MCFRQIRNTSRTSFQPDKPSPNMITLPEGYRIGKYTVKFFIKEGLYNGTYKIDGESGSPLFMKFYDLSRVPEKLVIDGDVEEIINCRKICHEHH